MRFVSMVAAGLVGLVACKGGDKSPPSTATSTRPVVAVAPSAPSAASASGASGASAATAAPTASSVKMVDGAKFLPAFPPAGIDGAAEKVARPTKEGFAEVAYRKGADDVAVVTITDTVAVPAVRADYAASTEKAAGYPLKHSGYYKSAILVADRFQVQIQSQRLKAEQRKAWFAKVDVKSLVVFREIRGEEAERHHAWLHAIGEGAFSFGKDNVSYAASGDGSWKESALGAKREQVSDDDSNVLHYTEAFLESDWKRFHDALVIHRFDVVHRILPRYGICTA